MSSVEFHRVDTSGISSSGLILAAIHCCLSFSRRCGDALIFTITLRSFKFNKLNN
uniref:Uncharacterized protein n=1 Tax=Rhizophagus irregularis (strain DAOM 181602 / DAOM 197198 / MUCL 43194) TaxID=747089 RepID=U9SWT4_RHIID